MHIRAQQPQTCPFAAFLFCPWFIPAEIWPRLCTVDTARTRQINIGSVFYKWNPLWHGTTPYTLAQTVRLSLYYAFTRKQTVAQQQVPVGQMLSALSGVSSVYMYVCQWKQNCPRNNDRRFYWGVRGPPIHYWFHRLDKSVPGTFLPPYQSFCGVSAQRTVLPWWLEHCQWISLFIFKSFYTQIWYDNSACNIYPLSLSQGRSTMVKKKGL